jgi:hypothetical protein
MEHQQKVEIGTEALKATPPVAYLGATFGGLSLPDWAALLAIVYTLLLILQMGVKGLHCWQKYRQGRRRAQQLKRRATDRT